MLDVRHACRLWARNPGFSIIAVLTVALGIGASTAIVSQINAVFWKPLPVSRPSELRLLAWTSPRRSFVSGPNVFAGPKVGPTETFGSFSYSAYVAMRDGARADLDLACWADLGEARPVVLGDRGFGALQFVSGNYFRVLGVAAHVGRTLQPEDDALGAAAPVAMISHAFWTRVFGQDPHVTRLSLQLNGHTFAIVGVMPAGFYGMDAATTPDVFAPVNAVQIAAATTNPLANPVLWNVCRTVARVVPGVSDQDVTRHLEGWVAQAIAAKPPPTPYDPPRIMLLDGSRGLATLRDAASVPLVVLFGAVVGLLLAACANIAGLLVARGSARERELATRLALGAPRARVVRQLITESLVLSVVGGVLGLGVAFAMAGVAPKFLSQFMPTLFGNDRSLSVSAEMDLRVFAFGAAAAIGSGLLFGLFPALKVTRVNLITTIRQATAGTTHRVFGFNAGHAMVMAQTALAMLLLVSAGLLLRTVSNLRHADLGFSGDGLLYARIEPRIGRIPNDKRSLFFQNAVTRLQSLPGVVAVSAASSPPIGGSTSVGVGSDAFPICLSDTGAQLQAIPFTSILPGFFETLGVRIIAGRDFTWTDEAGPLRTVIVNEAFARRFFPGQDPIGRAVRGGLTCEKPLSLAVIGVVSDLRRGLRSDAEPALYWPLLGYGGTVTLMVRTSGDAAAMIPNVRRAMTELNASIPTFSEATFGQLRERQLRREQLLSDLVTLFGTVTLLVCCLGIYGLLSFSVVRRRPEISVRMAIGAPAASIVAMILRESLIPVTAGIVLGTIGAIAVTKQIEGVLFGVSSSDPWVVVGASVVFVLVAAMAAALPARSAAKVDPLLALRM
jgi:predicted permease